MILIKILLNNYNANGILKKNTLFIENTLTVTKSAKLNLETWTLTKIIIN